MASTAGAIVLQMKATKQPLVACESGAFVSYLFLACHDSVKRQGEATAKGRCRMGEPVFSAYRPRLDPKRPGFLLGFGSEKIVPELVHQWRNADAVSVRHATW